MYLGVTGDEGIKNVGKPIRDQEDWRGLVMGVQDVVPPDMWDTEILVKGTRLQLLIRSLPCIRHSPSRMAGLEGDDATSA